MLSELQLVYFYKTEAVVPDVTSLIVTPHCLHVLVMGVVDFLVSIFDECFELSIYSNERRLINCVLTFLLHRS